MRSYLSKFRKSLHTCHFIIEIVTYSIYLTITENIILPKYFGVRGTYIVECFVVLPGRPLSCSSAKTGLNRLPILSLCKWLSNEFLGIIQTRATYLWLLPCLCNRRVSATISDFQLALIPLHGLTILLGNYVNQQKENVAQGWNIDHDWRYLCPCLY